ncbi:MAG: hypothetical protein IT558_00725 [Alphaproteobacteria bacterium]|nr:hypothetical protein [Alphaproteobacteria bacterium]
MPRDTQIAGIGHNSLAPLPGDYVYSDESRQVVIVPQRSLLECLREIPAHYLYAITNNQKLNECCREVENLSLEIRKTQDIPMDEPDLYVFQCACGRKHRRMLVESGHFGDPAKRPKKIHNPLFHHFHGDKSCNARKE